MRGTAVLLVLTKHKQLLHNHCWEVAGWPSSLVTSLTSEYVLPPVSLLCPHRKALLACSGVFKLAMLVMAQHSCSAFTQAANPPAFHGVPVSSPELSYIFPWIHERVNEFPSLLAKNWRSVWPSSEKVFMTLHSGTWKAKETTKSYLDMWSLWVLATWQDQVSPRCSYLC